MGNQLLSQVGNLLGLFAQNFPIVSTSAVFPNGTTDGNGLPIAASQDALSAFNLQARNAQQTAAFRLGNGLSILPGASQASSRLRPILFGSGLGSTSLASALQNFPFGSTGFNSAVSDAFNGRFPTEAARRAAATQPGVKPRESGARALLMHPERVPEGRPAALQAAGVGWVPRTPGFTRG